MKAIQVFRRDWYNLRVKMDTMKIYRLSSVCFAVLCRKNADKVVQNISHDLKMHGRIVFAVKLHELHTDSVTRMLSAPSVDFILFIKCQIICVATILTINIVSTLTTMQAITFRIVAHQTSNGSRLFFYCLFSLVYVWSVKVGSSFIEWDTCVKTWHVV